MVVYLVRSFTDLGEGRRPFLRAVKFLIKYTDKPDNPEISNVSRKLFQKEGFDRIPFLSLFSNSRESVPTFLLRLSSVNKLLTSDQKGVSSSVTES